MTPSLMLVGPDAQHVLDPSSMSVSLSLSGPHEDEESGERPLIPRSIAGCLYDAVGGVMAVPSWSQPSTLCPQ